MGLRKNRDRNPLYLEVLKKTWFPAEVSLSLVFWPLAAAGCFPAHPLPKTGLPRDVEVGGA